MSIIESNDTSKAIRKWLTPTLFLSILFLAVWFFNLGATYSMAMPASDSTVSEERESLDAPWHQSTHRLHPILLSYSGQFSGGGVSCAAPVKVALLPTVFDLSVKAEARAIARQDSLVSERRKIPHWIMNCSRLL